MFTQDFNVGDEVPGSVICGVGIRARLTTASLVEQNHSILRGVEEDGVGFGTVATWPPMEENDWMGLEVNECGSERCCTHQAFHPSCQTVDSVVHGYRRRAANPHPRRLRVHSR